MTVRHTASEVMRRTSSSNLNGEGRAAQEPKVLRYLVANEGDQTQCRRHPIVRVLHRRTTSEQQCQYSDTALLLENAYTSFSEMVDRSELVAMPPSSTVTRRRVHWPQFRLNHCGTVRAIYVIVRWRSISKSMNDGLRRGNDC